MGICFEMHRWKKKKKEKSHNCFSRTNVQIVFVKGVGRVARFSRVSGSYLQSQHSESGGLSLKLEF